MYRQTLLDYNEQDLDALQIHTITSKKYRATKKQHCVANKGFPEHVCRAASIGRPGRYIPYVISSISICSKKNSCWEHGQEKKKARGGGKKRRDEKKSKGKMKDKRKSIPVYANLVIDSCKF
jgi:hypothetical protein